MDMNSILEEAKKMQERMQGAQQELADLRVTGEAGNGLVKIEFNGRKDAIKTTINPNLLEEEVDMLEDLVTAAINSGSQQIEKISQGKIKELTAGLKLPENIQDQGDKDK